MMMNATGFSTARGKLIRAILFPKPSKFNFERQSFMFMSVLLLVLSCGIVLQVCESVCVRERETHTDRQTDRQTERERGKAK